MMREHTFSGSRVPYWGLLQGLSDTSKLELATFLLQSITQRKSENDTPTKMLTSEERKQNFLKLAGCWASSSDGEELYETMRERHQHRQANRDILSFDV